MPSPRRAKRGESWLARLARQFELPFFGGGAAQLPERTKPPRARPDVPAPAREADPTPKLRRIALSGRVVDYAFRRSKRRSIGFTVGPEGLTVTAPRWITLAEVEAAIREKEAWIAAKLVEMRERRSNVPHVRWEDGGTLPYLGGTIVMRVNAGSNRSPVRFERETATLTLSLPPGASMQQLKDRAQAWLQSEARRIFTERLDVYGAKLGVRHRALRLSSAQTRWGSCSANGRILLNWRLVHFPLSSIDYVVAHELAHLKEMNHGPRFWQIVEDIFPEFELARAQIKNPPPALLPTL